MDGRISVVIWRTFRWHLARQFDRTHPRFPRQQCCTNFALIISSNVDVRHSTFRRCRDHSFLRRGSHLPKLHPFGAYRRPGW